MAKFYGAIGYAINTETTPGVWTNDPIEREYVGDVIKNRRTLRSGEKVNPDVTISDTISIIADGFVLANLQTIRYVKWRGAYWSVDNIVVERPRVFLEIGGLYHGQTESS